MAFFPIADYRPDVADINGLFTDELINVLPADGSYIPMPSFQPFSEPCPDEILGALAVKTKSGVSVIVGTGQKIYLLDNTTKRWKDISKKGKSYLANIDAPWSFALFGDYIIAVNANDRPQIIDINHDKKFRDLGGNPPQAGIVRVWGDFVCLMKLTEYPRRIHWSGLNDAEFWTVGKKAVIIKIFPMVGLCKAQRRQQIQSSLCVLQSMPALLSLALKLFSVFKKFMINAGQKMPNLSFVEGILPSLLMRGDFIRSPMRGRSYPLALKKSTER